MAWISTNPTIAQTDMRYHIDKNCHRFKKVMEAYKKTVPIPTAEKLGAKPCKLCINRKEKKNENRKRT